MDAYHTKLRRLAAKAIARRRRSIALDELVLAYCPPDMRDVLREAMAQPGPFTPTEIAKAKASAWYLQNRNAYTLEQAAELHGMDPEELNECAVRQSRKPVRLLLQLWGIISARGRAGDVEQNSDDR